MLRLHAILFSKLDEFDLMDYLFFRKAVQIPAEKHHLAELEAEAALMKTKSNFGSGFSGSILLVWGISRLVGKHSVGRRFWPDTLRGELL